MKCVLCGRPMVQPAVTIADRPVGPKCARRAGLMPLALRRAGDVKPGPAYRRTATRQEVAQLDLFEVQA